MNIKYVVVLINTGGRGNVQAERHEFDNVHDAIKLHIKNKKRDRESAYWDIVVDYS